MAARVDLARVAALEDENAVLAGELAAAQQRSTRQASEHARQVDMQQAELVRLPRGSIAMANAARRLRRPPPSRRMPTPTR